MRSWLVSTHSVPVFEGRASRRHEDIQLWRLVAQAGGRIVRPGRLTDTGTDFVQFAGFPRSGHSLVGSLLDAHPDALISHELDVMGLVSKGVPFRLITRLIAANSSAFDRNGRWWNGYRYAVLGAPRGRPRAPRVIGDKKGDWALRHFADDPGLLDRLGSTTAMRPRWLLVVRDPLDNIATMSLRRGGAYDRLRIGSGDRAAFRQGFEAARLAGEIDTEASDAMIEDYRSLCDAAAAMKDRVPPEDWLEIVMEDFIRDPRAGLGAILDFLNLDREPEFLDRCASVVHVSPNRSRDAVDWSDAQRDAVRALSRTYPFLRRYADAP